MLAMLSQTLINQVDHILVGHLPQAESTPGQTALQISQILLWMFGGFLSAVAVGTQAMSARRIGESNPRAAGAVALNSLFLSLIASIVMAIICWFLAPFLVAKASKDPAVQALGIPFVRWRFLHIPSMVLFASMKSFFDSLGKTRVAMAAALLMNLVNFFLCIILVFGNQAPGIAGIDTIHGWLLRMTGNLPRMGVPGAGLAAMISSYVGVVIILLWSLKSKYRAYQIYHPSNLSLKTLNEIARLSFPSGLANAFAMLGFGFVIWVVGKVDLMAGHGTGRTIYSTATSNIISVLQLIFITCIAYGTATATLVSQSLGAKTPEMAERYAYTSVTLGVLCFAAIGLAMIFGAVPILKLWNPRDLEVLRVGAPILRAVGFIQPLIVIAIVLTQALYGAGNTRFVMVAELILHFVCLMPLCYLLGITFGFGIWGAWASLIIYVALLALIMFLKFRTGSWKHIRI